MKRERIDKLLVELRFCRFAHEGASTRDGGRGFGQ